MCSRRCCAHGYAHGRRQSRHRTEDQPHRPPTPQRVSSVPADLAPREGILNHLIG
jgi:hypothetical protein